MQYLGVWMIMDATTGVPGRAVVDHESWNCRIARRDLVSYSLDFRSCKRSVYKVCITRSLPVQIFERILRTLYNRYL